MAFPEFDRSRPSILFFCRGRGRGHAVPDAVIAREIAERRPDVQLHFVSYGTGARTLEALGFPVIDLGLPDDNSTVATTVLAGRLVGMLRPDLVVAHEEFAALPVARIFGVPAVLITPYFPEAGTYWGESLWHAGRILLLDARGRQKEPAASRGRVAYVGPGLRKFEYHRRDRARARRELGLGDGLVVAVFPGSWTEAKAPLLDRVIKAVPTQHQLIWLAGEDEALVRESLRGRRALVLQAEWQIDRLMCAADLAITKCSRNTSRELAALGIRTLSVSYGLNPADEQSMAPLASSRIVPPRQISRRLILATLGEPEPKPVRFRNRSCAGEILKLLTDRVSSPGS